MFIYTKTFAGFDVVKFLPKLDSVMGWIGFLIRLAVLVGPVLILVLGLMYYFSPPKEANHRFGYRFYWGMGSVEAWRFTQRIAGIAFGGLGLVLTLIMFFVSGGFASMAVEDMVWKALSCLVWQAILTVLATIAVHVLAFLNFDRNGEFRKKGNE